VDRTAFLPLMCSANVSSTSSLVAAGGVCFQREAQDASSQERLLSLDAGRCASDRLCVTLQMGVFLFGCAASQSFTDIAKVAVGRMRPHFLDVCKPDFSAIDCSLGYITNYTCTGPESDVQEAR